MIIVFVGFKPTYFCCKALTYKNRKKIKMSLLKDIKRRRVDGCV